MRHASYMRQRIWHATYLLNIWILLLSCYYTSKLLCSHEVGRAPLLLHAAEDLVGDLGLVVLESAVDDAEVGGPAVLCGGVVEMLG